MRRKEEKPTYDKPLTVIGEDTTIETSILNSKSSVQIAGNYIGNINVESSLVVSETGKIKGNINASFVLVAGEVVGNIDVKQQIHLTKTAKILGDINCKSIIIDEGGSIDGNCKMKDTVTNTNVVSNEKVSKTVK